MFGLKTIAIIEFSKGLTVLCIVLGFHTIVGYHSQVVLIQQFLSFLNHVDPQNISIFMTLAVSYSCLHIVEGFGLWHQKNWARWITIISTAIYLPFEFYEIAISFSYLKVCIIIINVLVLIYVISLKKKMI